MPRVSDPETRAIQAADPNYQLSGKTYIAAFLDNKLVRLPVVKYGACDHSFSICAQWQCIESWSMDYRLMFWRTVAGRELAAKLRIDDHVNLYAEHERVGLQLLDHESYVIDDPVG